MYLDIKINKRFQFFLKRNVGNHEELLLIGTEGVSHYALHQRL